MQLANYVGVKRITAHFNIENLIKKGLVTQTTKGSRRQIIAEPPENLTSLIEEKKQRLATIEADFPAILEKLKTHTANYFSTNNPFFRYYEGETGFKEVCQRSLDFADHEVMFLSNLDEWYKVYTVEYDKNHYIPIRLKKKLLLKLLVFKSQLTESIKKEDGLYLRHTKFLPPMNKFYTTTIIYGNEVSIMISSRPYFAITINNREYNNTFKSLFNVLWSKAD